MATDPNPMHDARIALGDAWRKFMENLVCAEYQKPRKLVIKHEAKHFEKAVNELREAIEMVLVLDSPEDQNILAKVEFHTIPVFRLDDLDEY